LAQEKASLSATLTEEQNMKASADKQVIELQEKNALLSQPLSSLNSHFNH
jgi:hypothetical protein